MLSASQTVVRAACSHVVSGDTGLWHAVPSTAFTMTGTACLMHA